MTAYASCRGRSRVVQYAIAIDRVTSWSARHNATCTGGKQDKGNCQKGKSTHIASIIRLPLKG
jgi:hypothetical protein